MRYLMLFESFNLSKLTIESLSNKLEEYNIPISDWGKEKSKNIQDLLNEIEEKECQILEIDGSLIRKIEFVGINVFYKDENSNLFKLKEDIQRFNDGRIRRRSMRSSVAEKMKSGEDPNMSAVRGIKEELGIDINIDKLIKENNSMYRENSMSYPGLQTEYTGHIFSLSLDKSQYNPNGYIEIQKDKSTYFIWIKE